jgi:hypothetical protein
VLLTIKFCLKVKSALFGGRRSTGYFKLVSLDGTIIHNSANSKKLKLIQKVKHTLVQSFRNI